MNDLRLIEDYLPIEAISAEASREKSVRKGHISTLHLWWARRPLVACRAAVYGALVPADRWVKDVNLKQPPDDAEKATKAKNGKKKGLNRKAAKEFVERLCKYPGEPRVIAEAQKHILEAHAERLSQELAEARRTGEPPAWVEEFQFTGEQVTYDDIVSGRAPRPRVLDMFAGGGAIPLEALRLGCEAYALDLNPVAHIIELCTLVYPQKYGQPDPNVRGMTGPTNERGETTWGGLAEEVRYWGNWVLEKAKAEIGDLYPPIPDPEAPPEEIGAGAQGSFEFAGDGQQRLKTPGRWLTPVAYLWTRTVRCKNPNCGATVPLARQTWLCKKPRQYTALKISVNAKTKGLQFDVVQADSQAALGFDPGALSTGGNATCLSCGAVADSDYVKAEGCSGRIGRAMMGIAATAVGRRGKYYLTPSPQQLSVFDAEILKQRVVSLCENADLTTPAEAIVDDAKNSFWVRLYGVDQYQKLFNDRQMVALLTFTKAVRAAFDASCGCMRDHDRCKAIATMLACVLDKLADFGSTLCTLKPQGGRGILHGFVRQGIPMTWDFAESNPLCSDIACWQSSLREVAGNIDELGLERSAVVIRGSATAVQWAAGTFDAVITDPPYYDNVSYADLSDFFYVWLKRSVGRLHSEHFATDGTPKKSEAVADATRHRSKADARVAYEAMMSQAFDEAHRVLKPSGSIVVVYAHKTTLGWSTLVNALRTAGFCVNEAWPLDTETAGRLLAHSSAALASSIFLIARKRELSAGVGNYEDDVQPELAEIVRERIDTLWDMGIAGADLVIACVGAGLRAFTKYDRVEYANGEEVPAEKFLAEVEGVVLDAMMGKLFGRTGSTISAIDAASRFYVLWRFIYKAADIDAGEAIVFTYGLHVELDGPAGLSAGRDALVEKKKAKYRARDFTERGDHNQLGLPGDDGQPPPLVDVLHRLLWLMEHNPRFIAEFLAEAQPDRERLRVLAQALAGAALSGKSEADAARLVATTPAEQAALAKLLANWRSVVERAVVSKQEHADRKAGQKRLELG